MPFNGSGVFQRVRNWVADATAGIKIRADYHDAEDDGFAEGLSNCITKDGQTIVTENIPFNSKRVTGLADPINPQDATTKAYADTKLAATGGAMTGDITVAKDGPTLVLNSTGAQGSNIQGLKNGKQRWLMRLGNDAAETGSNAGSDFDLHRYDDAGGYLGQAINITRANGTTTLPGPVTVNTNLTVGGTISASGTISTAGTLTAAAIGTTGNVAFGGTVQSQGVNCTHLQSSTEVVAKGGSVYASNGTVYLNWPANTAYVSDNGTTCTMHGASGAQIVIVGDNGRVRVGSGMETRQGLSGAYTGNVFNSWWSGSSWVAYVDNMQVFAATPSDYRIKKDVIALPGMWDAVQKLRPIKYKNKAYDIVEDGDVERWGFIAHELQDVLTTDAATGSRGGKTLQFPNQMVLITALTKALQEAMTRIEALEGKGA